MQNDQEFLRGLFDAKGRSMRCKECAKCGDSCLAGRRQEVEHKSIQLYEREAEHYFFYFPAEKNTFIEL